MVEPTPPEMDQLQEEFTDYQLLERSDIPEKVWTEALVYEDQADDGTPTKQYHRMDMVWGYIAYITNTDGSFRFCFVRKLVRLVLVIPHCNAGEERVFNLIKQNKTPTQSSFSTNGTLSSIIQVKLANGNSCIKWNPPEDLLKSAKEATKTYNDAYKTKL